MPIFLNEKDIAFFKQKNIEFYKNLFFPLEVFKVKIQDFDEVHGEDQNKSYEPPYSVEAYIPDLPGWKNYATKFGMDELRTLTVYFSLDILNSIDVEKPDLGDLLKIQDDYYLITQTNPLDFGSNLQVPLSHVVECKRYRYEKPDEGTVVWKPY